MGLTTIKLSNQSYKTANFNGLCGSNWIIFFLVWNSVFLISFPSGIHEQVLGRCTYQSILVYLCLVVRIEPGPLQTKKKTQWNKINLATNCQFLFVWLDFLRINHNSSSNISEELSCRCTSICDLRDLRNPQHHCRWSEIVVFGISQWKIIVKIIYSEFLAEILNVANYETVNLHLQCSSFQDELFVPSCFVVLFVPSCLVTVQPTLYFASSRLLSAYSLPTHRARTTRSWSLFTGSVFFWTRMCHVFFSSTCEGYRRTFPYRQTCCIIHWWQGDIVNIQCFWKIDAFYLFFFFLQLLFWYFSFLRVS